MQINSILKIEWTEKIYFEIPSEIFSLRKSFWKIIICICYYNIVIITLLFYYYYYY